MEGKYVLRDHPVRIVRTEVAVLLEEVEIDTEKAIAEIAEAAVTVAEATTRIFVISRANAANRKAGINP